MMYTAVYHQEAMEMFWLQDIQLYIQLMVKIRCAGREPLSVIQRMATKHGG